MIMMMITSNMCTNKYIRTYIYIYILYMDELLEFGLRTPVVPVVFNDVKHHDKKQKAGRGPQSRFSEYSRGCRSP